MKLYELERGQRFRVEEDAKVPPDAMIVNRTREFTFHNIDGMYSYCTDDFGRVYHPAYWTEVSVLEETK